MIETVLAACLMAAAVLLAYRLGLSDAHRVQQGKEIISMPKGKRKAKQKSEDARLKTIGENIDIYNGTAFGQKEVKK